MQRPLLLLQPSGEGQLGMPLPVGGAAPCQGHTLKNTCKGCEARIKCRRHCSKLQGNARCLSLLPDWQGIAILMHPLPLPAGLSAIVASTQAAIHSFMQVPRLTCARDVGVAADGSRCIRAFLVYSFATSWFIGLLPGSSITRSRPLTATT